MIGCCASITSSKLLKDASFSFIEPKLIDVVDNHAFSQLPIYAINNLIPRTLNFFGINNNLPEIKKISEDIINRAGKLNVTVLTLGSGKCRITDNPNRDIPIWLEYLDFLNKMCAKNDVFIGIEPLCKAETNFINTIKEAAFFIQEGSFSNIGITIDSYHFNQEDESISSINEFKKFIIHAHISDEQRNFPITIQPQLQKFLNALKCIGYDKAISVEIDWKKELLINQNLVQELNQMGF